MNEKTLNPATGFPSLEERPWLVSFGRRKSRKLSPEKDRLMHELLPRIAVRPEGSAEYAENTASQLGKTHKRIWLEIGFGGGEHLAALAERHPDVLFIGCEPYIDGVAKLLTLVEAKKLSNVRILAEDARLVLAHLPDASLEKVFILYPDPWKKVRHHKRRIVSQETFTLLHRVMMPQGKLLLATDHVDYSEWMLEQILLTPHFTWQAQREADFRTPPEGWVPTRYEVKTKGQGRVPVYYLLERAA